MKRKIIALLLVMSLASVFGTSVMAADDAKISGFYDIGIKQNVTIAPFSGNTSVSVTEKNLDRDADLEKVYENSDRLDVTYTAATANEQYGVILVDGSGLPTKDSEIYYINQAAADDSNVNFNVYPKLPTETTNMTLYISSSKENFSLVSVPMNYALNVNVDAPAPSYTPGDVNDDGEVDEEDVTLIRKHITGGYGVEINVETADVNADDEVDVKDVILIRRYIDGGYDVELK